jgi:hypothetical protein
MTTNREQDDDGAAEAEASAGLADERAAAPGDPRRL